MNASPWVLALVYLAGYGLQLEGENYFVPVDAKIATPSAVPVEAVRISDLTKPLAALQLKASIVVIDGARFNNFAKGNQPLAGGLALVDADAKMLIAFNAAPGTVGPPEHGRTDDDVAAACRRDEKSGEDRVPKPTPGAHSHSIVAGGLLEMS